MIALTLMIAIALALVAAMSYWFPEPRRRVSVTAWSVTEIRWRGNVVIADTSILDELTAEERERLQRLIACQLAEEFERSFYR